MFRTYKEVAEVCYVCCPTFSPSEVKALHLVAGPECLTPGFATSSYDLCIRDVAAVAGVAGVAAVGAIFSHANGVEGTSCLRDVCC